MARRACLVLAAALLAGCAGFTTMNVESPEADDKARGFRYYESAPFLVVFLDGTGAVTTEVLFLPDTTRKRSIQPYAYGASNKAAFTFVEGRLTQSKVVVDETALPAAILSALEKAALARIARDGAALQPSLHLFRIVKACNEWVLVGQAAPKPDCPGGKP